jgi:hypothetical protein
MINALLLTILLNGDISPQIGDLSPPFVVEARRRSKGNKKRRRGGNGLR